MVTDNQETQRLRAAVETAVGALRGVLVALDEAQWEARQGERVAPSLSRAVLPDVQDGLTAQQAAKLLQLSASQVYRLMSQGELPSITVGRSRRIPRAVIERLLASTG